MFISLVFKKRLFLFLFLSSSLFSTSIELTSPISSVNVKDGDEFFTDVMHNSIDFDKRRDIMWEENFNDLTINVINGVWNGTFQPDADQQYGAYVFPLFQGHGGVDGALNSGLTGQNYPVDTKRYSYISINSKVSARSVNALHWTRDGNWPDGTLSVTGVDCYWTNSAAALHPVNQEIIYLYNFSANLSWTDTNVTGLRHDASSNTLDGTTVSYKWFRIIDPTTSPKLTITWSIADLPSLSTVPHVKIYADTNNTGFNGSEIGSVRWGETNANFNGALQQVPYSDESYTFPTAILPSGDYYFYLKLFDNKDTNTLLATSGYSAKLTVNTKSTIHFENPSTTSGKDYATEVLNDPWDMNSSGDVINLANPDYQKNFANESFLNGIFQANAIIPSGSSQPHTDAQIWLNVDPQRPIDTARYHYLTYKLKIDDTYYTNIRNKVQYGWVTRAIWWNSDIASDGSSTKANTTYEEFQTYSFDIAPNSVIDPYDTYPSQTGWLANGTISNFRLDPLETNNTEGTIFYLDEVKLTANPEPVNNIFTSQFIIDDKDLDTVNVELYLDTDRQGYNGVKVASSNYTNGYHKLVFNTCKFSSGNYYLYAILTDTVQNKTYQYAEVPITVQAGTCSSMSSAIIQYILD